MNNAYQIIAKKRDNIDLTREEVNWFINGLLSGDVTDYQMSALLMAIYINGFSKDETSYLTDAMLYSGKTLSFEGQDVIDKHSTGGVGDKTSFIIAPMAAACGVKVPMIAGRGLGHTGGTVDKIESVKGFKTQLSLDEFSKLLIEKGMVLIGQTGDIAPADKKIYALRDVTATVESIPLITASIMSKKLAEGANGIVMDIKVGSGAFMSTKARAKALAKSIRQTGLKFNRNMMTIISDMNQPLGNAIGNSLEIIESVQTLKNQGPKDLTKLCIELAGGMIFLAGKSKTFTQAKKLAKKSLEDGSALQKFKELIENQGGDSSFIDDYKKLPMAKEKLEVRFKSKGFLKSINCKALGIHCVSLGGGRKKAEDPVDFGVGIVVHKKLGEKVNIEDSFCTLYFHGDQKELAKKIADQILIEDLKISQTKPKALPELVYETEINWSSKS